MESAGGVNGNYVKFYLNGALVHSGSGYGLYFVLINDAGDGIAVNKFNKYKIYTKFLKIILCKIGN